MPTLPLIVTPDPDEPRAIDIRLDVEVVAETVRAVLDTGGGSSAFATTPQTADLAVIEPATGRGITGTTAPDDVVMLPSLSLGPIKAEQVRVNRMPAGDERPSSVGMDVLGRHRCHFKFRSGVIEIDEPTPWSAALVPFAALPPGQPVVPVRFGSVETNALWDTGAALTFVNESFAAAHPELFDLADQSDGVDSAGARFSAQTATMAACEIGGVRFDPTPCAIVDFGAVNEGLDAPLDIGLGAPLIALNDWLFDFPAGTWAVTAGD